MPEQDVLLTRFDQLRCYINAYEAAMQIFRMSAHWPREEMYSLTDQIRRSSRSVCSAVAEAWPKRRYPAHFVSKLCDAEAEANETRTWISFAHDCGYIDSETHTRLNREYDVITGSLVKMYMHPEQWSHLSPKRVS